LTQTFGSFPMQISAFLRLETDAPAAGRVRHSRRTLHLRSPPPAALGH
jgi:hypothetical protein